MLFHKVFQGWKEIDEEMKSTIFEEGEDEKIDVFDIKVNN